MKLCTFTTVNAEKQLTHSRKQQQQTLESQSLITT